MARAKGTHTFFNFSGGLNTEASEIAPAPNTATKLTNVDLELDGSVKLRKGIEWEAVSEQVPHVIPNSELIVTGTIPGRSTGFTELAVYEWNGPAELQDRVFYIVRYGAHLYIYDGGNQILTAGFHSQLNIESFWTDAQRSPLEVLDMTPGAGVLVVTGKCHNPFYISYDSVADTFSTTAITINVRDFEGAARNFSVDERPATADNEHVYNLLNQGWPVDRINTYAGKTVVTRSGDTYTIASLDATNAWPSNADISYLGMSANADGDLVFSITELNAQTFGTTPAPGGRFILNTFTKDRSALTGISGIAKDPTALRPTATAFSSGRIFYGGEDGNIYFSQLLTDISNIGKCYQEQDPTAEQFNDLLATDGGVLNVKELGAVLRIVSLKSGVVLLAENGIWQVTGAEGAFSATDHRVTKISDRGVTSAQSVVVVNDTIFYWSQGSINTLAPDQISGAVTATDITTGRIKTLYDGIDLRDKSFAVGHYDDEQKTIMWLYKSPSSVRRDFDFTTLSVSNVLKRTQEEWGRWSGNQAFDKALILNVALNAFYEYEFDSVHESTVTQPNFFGMITAGAVRRKNVTRNITADGTVVTASGVDVTVTSIEQSRSRTSGRRIVGLDAALLFGEEIRFYDFTDESFIDYRSGQEFTWEPLNATYKATVETVNIVPSVVGDTQAKYVLPYFKVTDGPTIIDQPMPTIGGFRRYRANLVIIVDTGGRLSNHDSADGRELIAHVKDALKNIIDIFIENPGTFTMPLFNIDIIDVFSGKALSFINDKGTGLNGIFASDKPVFFEYIDDMVGNLENDDPTAAYTIAQNRFLNDFYTSSIDQHACIFITGGGQTTTEVSNAAAAASDMLDKGTGTLTGSREVNCKVVGIDSTSINTTTFAPLDNTGDPIETANNTEDLVKIILKAFPGLLPASQSTRLRTPGGCQVTGQWDWTTDGTLNKASTSQQGYKLRNKGTPTVSKYDDYPQSVTYSKLKVRGTGRAIKLRFESESLKSMHLLGYALPFTTETEA